MQKQYENVQKLCIRWTDQ